MDNDSFKRWMTDTVFRLASKQAIDRRGTVDPSACFLVFFCSSVALSSVLPAVLPAGPAPRGRFCSDPC